MKKKGFTLVELLAVIAILAILVIIALPNVLGMFNTAKKNTFVTEVQSIYSTAETQFVSDSMGDMTKYAAAGGIQYARAKGYSATGSGFKTLDLSGTTTIDYYIKFNLAGKVTEFYATDGQYQFIYKGVGLAKDQIASSDLKAGANETVSIENNEYATSVNVLDNDNNLINCNTGVITIADAMSTNGLWTKVVFSSEVGSELVNGANKTIQISKANFENWKSTKQE